MRWGILLLLFAAPAVFSRPHHRTRRTEDDTLLYWRRSSGPECEPFTTFTTDCNKCVCGADGTSYCTRMDCRKATTEKSDSYSFR